VAVEAVGVGLLPSAHAMEDAPFILDKKRDSSFLFLGRLGQHGMQPFRMEFTEKDVEDLHRCTDATRWPAEPWAPPRQVVARQ